MRIRSLIVFACVLFVLHAARVHAATELAELEVAAGRGEAWAQTQLGVRYENAEGVARDYEKAHRLYCLAAGRGDPEAQFRLGWVYANGRGVSRDDASAAALFALAAAQGHEYAARMSRFVPSGPGARVPSCMQPDMPVAILEAPRAERPRAAEEEPVAIPHLRPDIEKLVRSLAPQYAIDPRLALAVISVESAFNPMAVSPRNAQGLMQLIPDTAERFGVRRVFDSADNIRGGLAYLRWLLAFFQGDVRLVAAAYNAGERTVERHRGVPPFPETRDYVRRVTRLYPSPTHWYEAQVVEPSPLVAGQARMP